MNSLFIGIVSLEYLILRVYKPKIKMLACIVTLLIVNGEAKMAIDINGERWRQRASVFDGSDG